MCTVRRNSRIYKPTSFCGIFEWDPRSPFRRRFVLSNRRFQRAIQPDAQRAHDVVWSRRTDDQVPFDFRRTRPGRVFNVSVLGHLRFRLFALLPTVTASRTTRWPCCRASVSPNRLRRRYCRFPPTAYEKSLTSAKRRR